MNAATDTPKPERLADPVPDFAASISIGVSTAWKLIKDGKVTPIKIGARTLVTRQERDRFLAAARAS